MTYSEIFYLIDENLASGIKIPALKHREVEHALLDYIQANLSQSGDIKPINCDLTYYTYNFEVDGLGKNLRSGWAVCNGNNGTPNIAGKTIVGYGLGYSTFGATGGSKDAVVVSHSHTVNSVRSYNNTQGINGFYDRSNTASSAGISTELTGVDGTDKNMQPYIVQLYIMKL